ncbi:MAG: Bax inhibitor-1/YccA family protein [Bacteroidota bacterium]|nr:Bax inhibitor-1/YccA family protein [Bacteroidota bacterium]
MFNKNISDFQNVHVEDNSSAISKTFMANVFSWMAIALAITAFVAWQFSSSPALIGMLITESGISILGWIVMLAPIGLVLLMSSRYNKFSAQTLMLIFGGFSILMGMSLSFILLIYTAASIFQTFIITAGMFGVMAFLGYTTKTDLSKFGSLMMMGVVGIVIASLVNFFMHSSTLEYIISFAGVVIFTGLTAYDVQKLKRIAAGIQYGSQSVSKLTIMGALTLYLDFINLFLFLLRFLGDRK